MRRFEEEEKVRILRNYGFEVLYGYVFSNPTDMDYENHFVSAEEVELEYKFGPKYYFHMEGEDVSHDLSDAWEKLCDYVEDELDTDDEEHIYSYLDGLLEFKKEDLDEMENENRQIHYKY